MQVHGHTWTPVSKRKALFSAPERSRYLSGSELPGVLFVGVNYDYPRGHWSEASASTYAVAPNPKSGSKKETHRHRPEVRMQESL